MLVDSNSPIGDLEIQFTQAANIDQIQQLLAKIDLKRSHLDTTIKSFTSKRTLSHQSTVRSLEISRVELASTLNYSRNLKSIMEKANSIGYHITDKVRILDQEKSKISKLKTYVDNVNTLKLEMKRASESIEEGDYMNAANSISIIRNLPEGIIKDSYADFKVPTSDLDGSPFEILGNWVNTLEQIFTDGFNKASESKNVKQLTFYFQLFPLIGKSSRGVSCYSKFICNIISESSINILKSVRNNDSQPEIYAQILFKLFKTISSIINQHSRVIKGYYGDEVLLKILKDIQIECDLQSNLVFDTYSDSKDINSLKQRIRRYDYPVLITEITQQISKDVESENEEELNNSNDLSVSLIEINKATDELSAMMSHWAMYVKFFTVFWNDNLNNIVQVYPPPLVLSTFENKISKSIIQTFDLFCTYSVRRTLEKACTIESLGDILPYLTNSVEILQKVFKKMDLSIEISSDSLIPDDAPISSLADDLILVLNTIIMEVISTGQLISIKNMISNIKRILVVDFTSIIQQKLNKLILKTTSNLLTKSDIQKIHKVINPTSVFTPTRSQSPIGGNSTVSRVAGGANELANTGALFMKSLNNAISYTIAGEDDIELIDSGHASDVQKYLIYLNTLSTFSSYLEKLIGQCCDILKINSLLIIDDNEIANIQHSMEVNSESDIQLEINLYENDNKMNNRVKGLLKTISDGFRERSDAIIIGRTTFLFEKVLKLKVIKLVRESLNVDYLHTNDGYDDNGVSKLNEFVKNWNSLIIPYASTLTNDVFQELIGHVIKVSVISIEDKIWGYTKKISSMGALNLENDVSFVIGELTKFDYSLRDKFLKVTQMVMILGLEDDDELLELESSGIEWTITPSERIKCRNMLLK